MSVGDLDLDHDLVVLEACATVLGTSAEDARALAHDAGVHRSWLDGELPRRVVAVAAFSIDRHPVTNDQYRRFVAATGHRRPMFWPDDDGLPALGRHPVVGIDHDDALAYADWAGLRLPTEVEWERAARGSDGRHWPWGERFIAEACHWKAATFAPVDAHPAGRTPEGVLGLIGNVGEWCADRSLSTAAVRGGSFRTTIPLWLRPAARNQASFANNRTDHIGFRCAGGV